MTFQVASRTRSLPARAVCSQCGQPYPETGFPHRCLVCGGIFDLVFPDGIDAIEEEKSLTLGEGNTPLLPLQPGRDDVFVKCEHLNPTGSYKDRGTAGLVNALSRQHVRTVVEDSSGNAGASLAAFAARAGMHALIFAPASASGPKRAQIIRSGAELVEVPGPRINASQAVLEALDEGVVYASHAYQPHWLAGVAGLALEIIEDVVPGTVIAPVGQGGLLLGLHHGFQAAAASGIIASTPTLIGVQTKQCAPIWSRHEGRDRSGEWGPSLAEGICIAEPVRGDAVLDAVRQTGGTVLAVTEQEIYGSVQTLAAMGFDVEPTSAVVYAALKQLKGLRGPIVLILTGSGLKQAVTI